MHRIRAAQMQIWRQTHPGGRRASRKRALEPADIRAEQGIGESFSLSIYVVVYVFPVPVCPYANRYDTFSLSKHSCTALPTAILSHTSSLLSCTSNTPSAWYVLVAKRPPDHVRVGCVK